MNNYKITIQYDGTRYKGWQGQNSTGLTIQGKIEAVLGQMAGHAVEVIGSGRTDAGVHAKGQVANFHIEEHFTEEKILSYLNHYLPDDIAVIAVEQVDERFHSRYAAKKKTYRYHIHMGEISDVFERKYEYQYEKTLDVERMKEAASYLIGTHDFTSFCGNKKMKKTAVRTIYEITERTIDRYGQYFIVPDIELGTYWTNTSLPDETVIDLYHAHGESEQYHSEIKTDMDVGRLPSGKFESNKLVLELTMIAYNILRIIGQKSLKKKDAPGRKKIHRRRIRTVISNLMQFAGHLTEHAGRLVLSIGRSNRWRFTFKRLYDSFAFIT